MITFVVESNGNPEALEKIISNYCKEHNVSRDDIEVISKEEYDRTVRSTIKETYTFYIRTYENAIGMDYMPPADPIELSQGRTVKEKNQQNKYAQRYAQKRFR